MLISRTSEKGKFYRGNPTIKRLVDAPEVIAAVDTELTGAREAVKTDPPPQIVLRDGVLQIASHGAAGASLWLDAYAPQAVGTAGALKVAGVFVTGLRAASLWEQQGLSWKSVTTTADTGAQLFELASTVFPALQDHIALAKICVIACKALSEADKMAGPARTYFLMATHDEDPESKPA